MSPIADRSVSIALRAKVSEFVAGMGQAKRSTEDLSRQMVQTGAHADQFRKRLEAATKALPKIEIDADSSPAEIKFAQLRAQMEKLRDQKIGIDIDAASAQAQLQEIERELEKLQGQSATIDVKADIGAALAELRAVNAEVSRVNGQDAHVEVNANVGSALASIALVGAALAALPAVTTIAVGAAALGGAFSAAGIGAGAFAAVAIPGLTRVNEALKQTQSSAGGAGAAMKGAAQKAAEAAAAALRLAEAQDRVNDAADKVRDSQRKVQEAVRGVAEAKAAAAQTAEDAAYREVQAAARIADAERSVQDAHRATQRAIEDLTRAREAARERIEDLALATERGALSEERAQLSIRRAQAELARINASNASPMDKEDAALRLREAELALREIQERNGDLAKEREDSDKKGVEGSDEVVAAKERILAAQRAEADAERSLSDARAQAARDAVSGLKQVADANAKVADAQRQVADAQRDVIKAQRDAERAAQRLKLEHLQAKAALEAAGNAAGGGGGAASKMAALSKAERELAEDLKHFKDAYLDWQRSLQPEVFPVISQGLGLMERTLPKLSPLVKSSASAFTTLLTEAEKALAGPFWDTFLFNVNTQIPGAIIGLGRSFGNIATGFAGILDAFLPFTPTIVGGVEQVTKAFSEWGQGLKTSPEFHDFIEFVKREAPQVWELIKNVAKAIGNIVEALAPLGVGAFAGLGLLAQIVAGMDPGHIQGIALAIGAIKLATLGMSGIAAWQNLAGGLTATGAAAGKAQGKMAAFGKAAIGVSAGVIGLELLGSAMNGLAGESEGVGELTLALTELGQTGKWAGDLGNQWGGTFDDASKAAELFGDGLRELQDPSFGEMFWLHPLSELTAILPGIDSTVDQLEQKFSDMDKTLAGMIQSGNADTAAKAFAQLATQAAAQGIPIEKLNQLLPTYNQTLRVAGNAAAEAAAGVDKSKLALDGFNKSTSDFATRTDAIQAMRGLKSAFDEAKKAIEAANGKLEISAGMTDKQRSAVVLAREQFGGYIEKVRAAADGAKTLSGKTTDATRAVLEQLPELGKLAGKNQEAREQIIKLAEAYGISRNDAIKAMSSARGLRDMLAQLKSKEIEITAKTDAAKKAIQDLLGMYIKPIEIPVSIRAPTTPPKKKATGGIDRYAAGGIDYAAAAGMQTRPQPPGVVSKPTVLYGEGSSGAGATEAYIPYESQYRGRAVELLGQVADDFGLGLYNKQAADQVSQVAVTVGESSIQLGAGIQSAIGVMADTMGQTGSLTSAISQVGVTGDALSAGWTSGALQIGETVKVMGSQLGESVTGMSGTMTSSIDTLSVSVSHLGDVLTAAAAAGEVGATATKSTAPRKGKAGKVDATAKKSTAPRSTGGMIAGDYGLSGTPDWVTPGGSSMSSMSMGAPANSSRMSAPQQMHSGYSGSPAGGPAGSGGSVPQIVNKSVNFNGGQTIKESADADVLFAKASMSLGGRG